MGIELRGAWRPDDYDAGFAALAGSGQDVHGEAAFVESLGGHSVLDAGCGTGRVAVELARRGIDVVGTDRDRAMLAAARAKAPEVEWVLGDLATVTIADAVGATRLFEVAVMAGNVMIFVDRGSEGQVLANVARHVSPGGLVVAGFQLARGKLTLDEYDDLAGEAGLVLAERWSTWSREPFTPPGDYAVSVHRKHSGARVGAAGPQGLRVPASGFVRGGGKR